MHRRILTVVFGALLCLGSPSDPGAGATPPDRRQVDEAYFNEDYERSAAGYRALLRANRGDAVAAYRLAFSLDELPGRKREAEKARTVALELLEKGVATQPSPEISHYLAELVEPEDAARAARIRTEALDRHAQGPATDVTGLYRLAQMARLEQRPTAEILAISRLLFEAEGGAWREHPLATRVVEDALPAYREAGALDELLRTVDAAVAIRPQDPTLRVARAQTLLEAGRREEVARELDAIAALGPSRPDDLYDLASMLDALDRDEEGVEWLRRATQIAPRSSEPWWYLGSALRRLDRNEEALRAFDRLLAIAPDDSLGHCRAAYSLSALGRRAEAERRHRRFLKSHPSSMEARECFAAFLTDDGRCEEALLRLDAPGMEGEPDAEFLHLRIDCLTDLGRYGDAIADAERSLVAHGDEADLHRDLALALERRKGDGDLERAEAAYREAIRLDPEGLRPQGDLARLLIGLDRESEAAEVAAAAVSKDPKYDYGWLQRGRALAAREETWSEAVACLVEAVSHLPDSARLYRELGLAQSRLQRREEAVSSFRRALELQPDSADYADSLAIELSLADRRPEALQVVDAALARASDDADLLHRRGILLDDLGRTTEAEQALHAALHADPERAGAHHSLGVVLSGQKRHAEALVEFGEAIRLRPGFELAIQARAATLLDLGRWDEAVAAHREITTQRPENPVARLRLGRALVRSGRFEEAESTFLAAAAMPGADGWPWIDLGDLRRDRSRPDDALEAYSQADRHADQAEVAYLRRVSLLSKLGRHLDGARLVEARIAAGHDDATARKDLAILYKELGDFDRARQEAQRSLELAPASPTPPAVLGDIEVRAGKPAEAAAWYERSLQRDPADRQVWLALASQRLALGATDGAREALLEALERGEDAGVRRRLAQLEDDAGRETEADAHWSRAAELAGSDAALLQSAAAYQERRGRATEAVKLQRRAAEAAPGTASIRCDFGLSLLRQGATNEAIAELRAALDIDPEESRAEEALRPLAARRPELAAFLAGLHLKPLALDSVDVRAVMERYEGDASIYRDAAIADALHFSQLEVLPDGRTIETYHGMRRILQESGVGSGEIRFSVDRERDRVEIHFARTHLPDGRIVEAPRGSFHKVAPADTATSNIYDDNEIQVISMPSVQVGSVLEYSYTIASKESLTGRHWWRSWIFDGNHPTTFARFVLRRPKNLAMLHTVQHLTPHYEEREAGETLTSIWTATELLAVPDEERSAPLNERSGRLLLSTFPTWDAVALWFAGLAANQYLVDADLRSQINIVLAGATEPEEITRRLTQFVQANIRYVGIEFGIGGFKPRAAREVLANRFGDCKDKATLLIAMLTASGVEAYPALLGTWSRESLAERPPSPGAFDHAIVYVPALRGGMFIDPTASFTEFGDLPPMDQGSEALVVFPGEARMIRVPVLPPTVTTVRSERRIDLADPASASFVDQARATGAFGAIVRGSYGRMSEEELQEQIHEDVRGEFPGAVGLSIDASGARAPFATAVVIESFRVPELLQPLTSSSHLLPLTMGQQTVADLISLTPEDSRRTDYIPQVRFTADDIVEVNLPTGWQVEEPPKPVGLDTRFGRFRRVVTSTTAVLRVEHHFELHTERVPVADYGEFAAFIQEAARHQKANFILREPVRAGTGPMAGPQVSPTR